MEAGHCRISLAPAIAMSGAVTLNIVNSNYGSNGSNNGTAAAVRVPWGASGALVDKALREQLAIAPTVLPPFTRLFGDFLGSDHRSFFT